MKSAPFSFVAGGGGVFDLCPTAVGFWVGTMPLSYLKR